MLKTITSGGGGLGVGGLPERGEAVGGGPFVARPSANEEEKEVA